MAITQIQPEDWEGKDVASLDDAPNISAAELKAAFDRMSKEVIIPAFNALVSELLDPAGGANISQTITGMAGTNVAALIEENFANKAPLESPGLTGEPTAPTATAGTNSAQIATTAFVKTAIDNAVISVGAGDMAAGVYDPNGNKTDIYAYADAAGKMATYTLTLDSSLWVADDDEYTQSVSVPGLSTTGFAYIVSPDQANAIAYGEAQIIMEDVTVADTATFFAKNLPTENIDVRVLAIRA